MKDFLIKIKDKIKAICNKEYLKNNMDKVVIFGVVFVLLIGILIYFLITRSVSKIEENKIREKSDNLINYINDISDNKSKEVDKYIIFALDYSYNVNSKNKMTSEEISDFLSKNFTKKFSADDVKKMGISPSMLDRNITYDSADDSYKLNNPNKSASIIAKTEIVYYKLKKIRKFNSKKYTVTYTKYIIEDPYKFMNYYIDNNSADYTVIKNYLMGSGKILDVYSFIREHEKDLKNYAKKKGSLKVTYVAKNGDNLLISSIK